MVLVDKLRNYRNICSVQNEKSVAIVSSDVQALSPDLNPEFTRYEVRALQCYFSNVSLNAILPHVPRFFQVVSFPQISVPKPCMHLYSALFLLLSHVCECL